MFKKHRLAALLLALVSLAPLPVLAQTSTPATTSTTTTTTTPGSKKSTKSTTVVVNVNTATSKELQQVKGIGAATAKKIIAARPYKSLDELVSKKVLSSKQFDRLKPQLAL
ncbi:Hef nuclease [Gloeobacter kilaueensis JS1]|uniref:Hef nuclease n=1 Tax=Gloeobacter kilaueensis (strain ATCC BAA-2537 / CCAP 1431/1 / ULC 316 / JS1) TaxID=1183438 RepID=U5QDC0_GLOK1|nr:Hef nuclease [Gloeobacter kilaueensis JS1]